MLPNDDDFIDPPTIIVYLDKNLVPALLEDIISYCRKIAAYYDDEKLLMHFFQDSLMGHPSNGICNSNTPTSEP